MRSAARLRLALIACALAAVLSGPRSAMARIKLVTLPARERVELQFDNPNFTLVEEERIVTLLQGSNKIDFSWTNTAIDKGTIQFRVVDMPVRPKKEDDHPSVVRPDGQVETIQVINVAYPPGENALVWEVFTGEPVAARVRISYLISRLTRSFNYRAVAEHDESTMTLRKYIRLGNFSGEEFGNSGIWAGFGEYFHREIGMNEAKELLIWKFKEVPIKKTYTFDWWRGQHVPNEPEQRYVEMRYVLQNDEEHKLGEFPLQFGKVRIFQDDGRGTTAFLGEDWGKFTPLDDEMRLYLGVAQDIVVKRTIEQNNRRRIAGNLYDHDIIVKFEIENFKDQPVTLDVKENLVHLRNELIGNRGRDIQWELGGQTTFAGGPDDEDSTYDNLVFHADLPAAAGGGKADKIVHKLHIVIKNEW